MLTSMNIRVTVEHAGSGEVAVRTAVLREFQEMARK